MNIKPFSVQSIWLTAKDSSLRSEWQMWIIQLGRHILPSCSLRIPRL